MSLAQATAVLAIVLATSTHAGAQTLAFPGIAVANAEMREYACSGNHRVEVSYVNTTDGDSLAMLEVDGRPHVFVAAMAASGVRYVSGPYVWWTKGPHASLVRDDDQDGKPLLAGCAVVMPTKAAHDDAGGHARP
jgi:membrane-bound inhibitor of C-type lysozyme